MRRNNIGRYSSLLVLTFIFSSATASFSILRIYPGGKQPGNAPSYNGLTPRKIPVQSSISRHEGRRVDAAPELVPLKLGPSIPTAKVATNVKNSQVRKVGLGAKVTYVKPYERESKVEQQVTVPALGESNFIIDSDAKTEKYVSVKVDDKLLITSPPPVVYKKFDNKQLSKSEISLKSEIEKKTKDAKMLPNSPIFYIRIPPSPYNFVPGFGYISTPTVDRNVVPVEFSANGKPSSLYFFNRPVDSLLGSKPQNQLVVSTTSTTTTLGTTEQPEKSSTARDVTDLPLSDVTDLPMSEVTDVPESDVTENYVNDVTDLSLSDVTDLPVGDVTGLTASGATGLPLSSVTDLPVSSVTDLPVSSATGFPLSVATGLPLSSVTDLPVSGSTDLPVSGATGLQASDVTESAASGLPVSSVTDLPLSGVTDLLLATSTTTLKPPKSVMTNSKITYIKGNFPFNGKPSGVYAIHSPYKPNYFEILHDFFYPGRKMPVAKL